MIESGDELTRTSRDAQDRLQRQAASREDVISFAGGLPDPALFPKRELTRAFLEALAPHDAAALQYGWPEGSARLRELVARRLAERGARVEAERVLITSGAQQALSLALKACLAPGDRVGVDPETYPGALHALSRHGAVATLMHAAARAYYAMPALSNPRGQTLGEAERRRLMAQAEAHDAFVLEDDAYAETCFAAVPPPLVATHPERVFHIGTFSKTLCPGLRVGFLVPPTHQVHRCLEHKQDDDLQANGLAQALVERYLAEADYDAHLARSRRRYQRRAGKLARAVKRHLPAFRFSEPRGGFSIWLESELPIDESRLLELAVAHGVSFDGGNQFRLAPAGLSLRLSYSSVPEREIEPGVERLARAVRAALRAD